MSIAPALTVRCDTFTIRTYGEAHDSKGNVTARAWCEATVQRSAEYIDPTNLPDTEVTTIPNPLTPTNEAFGRKFKVITFRWLSSKDV